MNLVRAKSLEGKLLAESLSRRQRLESPVLDIFQSLPIQRLARGGFVLGLRVCERNKAQLPFGQVIAIAAPGSE